MNDLKAHFDSMRLSELQYRLDMYARAASNPRNSLGHDGNPIARADAIEAITHIRAALRRRGMTA